MFEPTLHEPYLHVWSGDPAIDTERRRADVEKPEDADDDWKAPLQFDYAAFLRTGDRSHLPLKNGGTVMVFHVRHMRGDELAYARGLADQVSCGRIPFGLAYHRVAATLIDSWEGVVVKKEGRLVDVAIEHAIDPATGMTVVKPHLMDMLQQAAGLVSELGARAVQEDLIGNPT